MKILNCTIPEKLYNIIEIVSENFDNNKSEVIRSVFDRFSFLYDFMMEYMQPNKRKPPEAYLDSIKKIGDIISVLKG